MTQLSPCADRTNDPQDWFIRPDGKQYTDEDLLSADERQRITKTVLAIEGESLEQHGKRVEAALNAARANRRHAPLARRRQAKDLCWTACPIQSACLAQAMERGEMHGTWGGYFEEELAEIRKEQARRRRRKGNEPTLF